MKNPLFLLLAFLLLGFSNARSQSVDSALSIYLDVANVGNVAAILSWTDIPSVSGYQIFRRFPDEDAFSLVGSSATNSFTDTVRRIVCSDTLFYFVKAETPSLRYYSNTQGAVFSDPYPTSPCQLDVCSVDPASGRIMLSWFRSPDPDIVGYFICSSDRPGEEPYLGVDTVWGAEQTSFLVPERYSSAVSHSFRIYAFDSCGLASALTNPYNNIILEAEVEDCSHTVRAQWNAYEGMPGGLDRYEVKLLKPDGSEEIIASVSPNAPRQVSYTNLSLQRAVLRVEAVGVQHPNRALSNSCPIAFLSADTAQFLELMKVSVADDNKSVRLTIHVDPSFPAHDYRIYRSEDGGTFSLIAQLPNPGQEYLSYVDASVSLSSRQYRYRVGVMDGCGINEKYSLVSPALVLQLEGDGASGAGEVGLRWNAYTGWDDGILYQILRRKPGEPSWTEIGTTHTTQWVDPSSSSANYCYRVAAWRNNAAVGSSADSVQSSVAMLSRPSAVWFPNVITPDAAECREFVVRSSFLSSEGYHLYIYNRQGLLVFQSADPEASWDGTYRGSPCPQGAYVYVLYCTLSDHSDQIYKGTVLLLR